MARKPLVVADQVFPDDPRLGVYVGHGVYSISYDDGAQCDVDPDAGLVVTMTRPAGTD